MSTAIAWLYIIGVNALCLWLVVEQDWVGLAATIVTVFMLNTERQLREIRLALAIQSIRGPR